MTWVSRRRQHRALRLSLPSPPPSPLSGFGLSQISPPFSPATTFGDLEKVSVLGGGNGGTVYKVRPRNTSSTTQPVYALKVVRFDQNAAVIRLQVTYEAEILKRVDSQFIVKCHGVFDTLEGDVCFVMEYMERGSLDEVLQERKVLGEDVVRGMAERVVKGLKYLHGMQIVHGDIKPSNLLINGKGEVKIADFGVSKIMAGSGCTWETCMGTCAYMSPERVDPERWSDGSSNSNAGFAGDVWSLGVVVLECMVGHYPLIRVGEKPDWAALAYSICFEDRVEMPEKASVEFGNFVRVCLEKDWRKRATVDDLLLHPFLKNSCEKRSRSVLALNKTITLDNRR